MHPTSENHLSFNLSHVLEELSHQLPAQAPLKDFIHHNTLHAFQYLPFKEGIRKASRRFGYRVLLPLKEYRQSYNAGRINHDILVRTVQEHKGLEQLGAWVDRMVTKSFEIPEPPRIGMLRGLWKRRYKIDIDSLVHPILFRILCNYLDQGISIWQFPEKDKGFLEALRAMERNSAVSLFRTKRGRALFLNKETNIEELLSQLVDGPNRYAQYLFDQQFAHQGWSGMVATVEHQPFTLLDKRDIKLEELIFLELVLEIDALEYRLGNNWKPLPKKLIRYVPDLFEEVPVSELEEVLFLWHLAFEWSYYDTVLGGIHTPNPQLREKREHTFQSIFCIDDRECSLRRYLENEDPNCYTYGSPGFFGIEFYFQPVDGKFTTKLCPAPVNPSFLIKEVSTDSVRKRDLHLSKEAHSLHSGLFVSQTLGFWSALKLAINVFNPKFQPGAASSFGHMSKQAELKIERTSDLKEGDLYQGFSAQEMATRVETTLRSIGLVKDFAPIVYIVGHGASSTNNPHYAAYDCGACSGRAGSVNARVFCAMANHREVRDILASKGIHIPNSTQFVGALHDTTRDEIEF
ncbi:MAG: putative inorganic carbon transporter subunit DabA, partial [Flavobacteriales bacterium]